MEVEIRPEEAVLLDLVERLCDQIGPGGVVGGDLIDPHIGAFIVRGRAEDEAPVRAVVLGGVERAEIRNEREAVTGELGGGKFPVDRVEHRVHEVQLGAVSAIDDRLDGARAGDGGIQRQRCQHVKVFEAADLAGERRVGTIGEGTLPAVLRIDDSTGLSSFVVVASGCQEKEKHRYLLRVERLWLLVESD